VRLALHQLFEMLERGNLGQLEDALGDQFEIKGSLNRDHARSSSKAMAGALQGLCRDATGAAIRHLRVSGTTTYGEIPALLSACELAYDAQWPLLSAQFLLADARLVAPLRSRFCWRLGWAFCVLCFRRYAGGMNLIQKGGTLLLQIKVVPNSSRTQIAGVLGDALKIKVAQPPEDGRANQAVLELLAQTLEIPGANLAIVAGHTRPRKTVQIMGLGMARVIERLGL
jgi:hypothetical protein